MHKYFLYRPTLGRGHTAHQTRWALLPGFYHRMQTDTSPALAYSGHVLWWMPPHYAGCPSSRGNRCTGIIGEAEAANSRGASEAGNCMRVMQLGKERRVYSEGMLQDHVKGRQEPVNLLAPHM
jgi:hypothetical protein